MSAHQHDHHQRQPVSLYALGAVQRLALAACLAALMWLAVWAAL